MVGEMVDVMVGLMGARSGDTTVDKMVGSKVAKTAEVMAAQMEIS